MKPGVPSRIPLRPSFVVVPGDTARAAGHSDPRPSPGRAAAREGLVELARLVFRSWPLPHGADRFATALLRLAVRLSQRPHVESVSDGRQFLLDLSNSMHRHVLLSGSYEPAESTVIAALVRPGDAVIDLGANFGWYTTLLALLVGPSGRVDAFEPLPTALYQLRVNLHLSGLQDRVVVHPDAVGAARGETTVHLFRGLPEGHASESTLGRSDYVGFRVAVVALDDWLREGAGGPFSFMKCDVEGAEMNALTGASGLLRSSAAPIVMIEINHVTSAAFGYDCRDLVAFLRRQGYEEFYRVERRSMPALRRLVGDSSLRHGDNIVCVPRHHQDRVPGSLVAA